MARAFLAAVYACYLAAVGYLVFQPSAGSASTSVQFTLDLLHHAAVLGWIHANLVEIVANVVLFVPMGLLGMILVRRSRWWHWLLIGAAASGVIELVQLTALPGRTGSWRDVVTNAAGAALGGLAAHALARWHAGRGVRRTTSG